MKILESFPSPDGFFAVLPRPPGACFDLSTDKQTIKSSKATILQLPKN